MPIAEVSFYNVILFFHITAVVLAFGPTFAYPVMLGVAERSDKRAFPTMGRAINAWEKIGTPMLLVVLAAGIYLVADGPWGFGDFFVSWSFAYLILIGAVSGMYFAPKTNELIAMAERDIEATPDGQEVSFGDDFHALNDQVGKVGMVMGLLAIVTIYIMTAKPFL